jgi:hypothetical protein
MDGPTGCSAEWVLLNPAGIPVRGNALDLNGDGTPDGAMAEEAPGHYTGTIEPTPLSPPTIHGYHKVVITLRCATGDISVQFDIYIDPSGVVQDTLGNPVSGATVTLSRADASGGPFTDVPGGSAIMSLANRTNPMMTDGAGRYGWDVIAGFYRVRAEKEGCVGAESAVLTIPPPVTDLVLTLSCTADLGSIGPARVWVGLRNSDAVGLRLDLRAEALINGTKVAEGQVDSVATGSSGFGNAHLRVIPMNLVTGAGPLPPGASLQLVVSARRTCAGGGHASGAARLWYGGQPIDSGRGEDAGSRLDTTIRGVDRAYFLRGGLALSETAGAAKLSGDVAVDSKVACPSRPFTPFGTWTTTLP